jgi:hypothetical protein
MRGSTQALLVRVKHGGIIALLVVSVGQPAPSAAQVGATQQQAAATPAAIDPKAIAILRASCDALGTAQTMTFTAEDTFERPARNGQPLYHAVLSHVTMQRPDKLRVLKLAHLIHRTSRPRCHNVYTTGCTHSSAV